MRGLRLSQRLWLIFDFFYDPETHLGSDDEATLVMKIVQSDAAKSLRDLWKENVNLLELPKELKAKASIELDMAIKAKELEVLNAFHAKELLPIQ